MIDGANIQHYGYLVGCGAAVLGSGLVGLLLGRWRRQKARDSIYANGYEAGYERGRQSGHAEGYHAGVNATGFQPMRTPHTMVPPSVAAPPSPSRPACQAPPVRRRDPSHAKPAPKPEPRLEAPTEMFTALLPTVEDGGLR